MSDIYSNFNQRDAAANFGAMGSLIGSFVGGWAGLKMNPATVQASSNAGAAARDYLGTVIRLWLPFGQPATVVTPPLPTTPPLAPPPEVIVAPVEPAIPPTAATTLPTPPVAIPEPPTATIPATSVPLPPEPNLPVSAALPPEPLPAPAPEPTSPIPVPDPWQNLPELPNSYGAGEPAAGSYLASRIPLSSEVPPGVYKFVVDTQGNVWLAPASADVTHSALLPPGANARGAGYIAISNGRANVNGTSGHYMAAQPFTDSHLPAYVAAIRATFLQHGVTVVDINPGLGTGITTPSDP